MKPSQLAAVSSLASALGLAPLAFAQQSDYPSKPVRLVLAQPAGGGADIKIRLFANKLSSQLGQQFIVDNRTGSGVSSASTLTTVARAAPDGYTVMAVTPSLTFAPMLVKDLKVDVVRDFAAVSLLTKNPQLLVVNPSLPVKSVQDLIALAKAKPGELNFGAGAIGSGTHLATMWFLTDAGMRNAVTYVPYKGTAFALTDLLGARIQGAITSTLSSGPFVKQGKLRALGISSAQRAKSFPEIPTIAEQGVPSYDSYSFNGLVVPSKTPSAIIGKLSQAAARAARSPDLAEKVAEDGGETVGSTPEEFARLIAREVPRLKKLISDLGVTPSGD